MQENVLEHCAATDAKFDVKQSHGLRTPAIGFVFGEPVADVSEYETWL